MSVHSSGSGSGWNESLDVDQPHGLDYQEWQDIRIGTRLRMSQEHSAFADSTAGGIHTPGGCAVVGMDITDDCTGGGLKTADGTYRGHGLVWSLSDTSNYGVLWCSTSSAGVSSTGNDFTVLKMHPDLQWAGGDVTWAGAHLFKALVDCSANLNVDSSADFSDVFIAGDISVNGDFAMDGSFLPTTCATDFGGFLDEDDLASDATASVASQQSVKAYADSYIKLVDSKATTVNGGDFTSGAWIKRVVAEESDIGSHVAVSSSVIVLDAGTYQVYISCPAYKVNQHQARLRNTTAGSTILVGSSEITAPADGVGVRSVIAGIFTIAGSQNLEIQHRALTARSTNGFGASNGFGEVEIYTIAEFWKR